MTDLLKKAVKIVLLPVLLTAAFFSVPITVCGAETGAEIIEVKYGYENNAKPGRFLPVKITLGGSSGDFFGKISITARESDNDIYEYIHEADVPAGTVQTFSSIISVGRNANRITVRLLDEAGNIIQTKGINLNIDRNNTQLFIGALSDSPDRLAYFDDVSINYGLLRSKVFKLSPEDFPENANGLDLFDIILVSDFRVRDLNDAQTRALMDWVKSGGVMLLGTGRRADDTLGRFAPELLEDMYEAPELTAVNFGPEFAQSSPDDAEIELYCVNASIHGGNVVLPGDDFALITSVNKENGLIAVPAFDLCDLQEFAQTHQKFADRLLTKVLGSDRLSSIAGELFSTGKDKFSYVETLVSTGDMTRLPPVSLYALSIFAYILLLGPGLYMFLKSRDMSGFYRTGVILLAVVFTIIMFAFGSRTRFEDTFYNFATIIDSDEDTRTETAFINLRNPFNRSFEVILDNSYQIYPIAQEKPGVTEDSSETESKVRISYQDDGNRIAIGDIGAFTPKYFQLEKSGDNTDGEGFGGYVCLFANEISGEIENRYSFPVSDAVLMLYGRMVVIGNMQPGEIVDLSGEKPINIPLSDSRGVAEYVTEDMEKANVLTFYRDFYMKGYTQDARVIAFTGAETESGIISNRIEGYGLSMMTSSVPVDNWQDDKLYRNSMVRIPTVISGQYSYDDNTMSVSGPVVIEYTLGNDMDISGVLIEWPDVQVFTSGDTVIFEGDTAFYNYDTGHYDSIEKDVTVYSAQELEKYMSPANTLTVRYSYNHTAGGSADRAALPMIGVVGNVRN